MPYFYVRSDCTATRVQVLFESFFFFFSFCLTISKISKIMYYVAKPIRPYFILSPHLVHSIHPTQLQSYNHVEVTISSDYTR